MAEHIYLSWSDYERCTLDALQLMIHREEFTDVTLVCDGDKQIRAHKIIISACSPFFRNILLKNPHPHPLIYLNGVKFDDLKCLIDFMYSGQTQVPQDDFRSFIKAGLDLSIQGLGEGTASGNELQPNKIEMEPKI